MNRDAIVVTLIAAMLAAIVIASICRAKPDGDSDGVPDDQDLAPALPTRTNPGPAYLSYNAPFFFAPPIQNFLPRAVAPGQGGNTINTYSSGTSNACDSCSDGNGV